MLHDLQAKVGNVGAQTDDSGAPLPGVLRHEGQELVLGCAPNPDARIVDKRQEGVNGL
jgi:hypothetical protein